MYVGSRNPGTLRVAAVFHKDLQMSSNLFTGTVSMDYSQQTCDNHGISRHYFEKGKYGRWKCCKCNVERAAQTRRTNKLKLVELFGGQCTVCGYNRCIAALEFHHLEPEHKDFGLGRSGASLPKLIKEAQKCILVCCRCHREIHSGFIHVSPNGRASSC